MKIKAGNAEHSAILSAHIAAEKFPYPFFEVVDTGESVKFDMDGNQWCATRASFRNLQEDPAGFGDTPMQSLANLIFNEGLALMEQTAANRATMVLANCRELLSLCQEDVFTDAHEYSDRVTRIREIVYRLSKDGYL